jgi:3',5'-cyclic-AMP phosphodiesterase
MIIAQISDTHIKRKGRLLHHMIDTARYLKRAVKRLNALEPRPDVVVATGDLVESGKAKEYKRLRQLLGDLEIPLFVIPGNHDDRTNFRDAFADHTYLPKNGPYLQYVIEQYPVRLIGVDSTADDISGGEIDELRLRWLETRLSEQPARPTIVFMHHPPFKTGIKPVDALGFRGVDHFAALIRRHPQVVRILSGHIHRPLQVPWAGTYASTAPSTAHQIVLDVRERQPLGFVLEPPGFALHVWESQTGLVSYACLIDALGAVVNFPALGMTEPGGHLRAVPTFVARGHG